MPVPGPPQMSPDGAYWWDGQKWQPMPRRVPPPVPAPAAQQDSRPSWLAEPSPPMPAPARTQPVITAPVPVQPDQVMVATDEAPPLWAQPAKPSAIRTVSMLGAGAALALMLGWAGISVWQQNAQNQSASSASPAQAAAPGETATPGGSPVVEWRLSAKLGGQYCPVVHPGDTGCWKGSLVNTGPTIGKLAITFTTASPYNDWFGHHTNAMLSGYYTTPGCELDSPHLRIVCGPVAPNATVNVYLIGDVTTAGTFKYAAKFADISTGSPVYVNQRPDGTHEVVSWSETTS